MLSIEMLISCPRNIVNSADIVDFFIDVQRIIKKKDNCKVVLDMSNTRVFDVNLLAMLCLII